MTHEMQPHQARIPANNLYIAVHEAIPHAPLLPEIDANDFYQQVALQLLHARYDNLTPALIRTVGFNLRRRTLRDDKIHQRIARIESLETYQDSQGDILDESSALETPVFTAAFYADITRILGPKKTYILLQRFQGVEIGKLAKQFGLNTKTVTKYLEKSLKKLAEDPEFKAAWESGITE